MGALCDGSCIRKTRVNQIINLLPYFCFLLSLLRFFPIDFSLLLFFTSLLLQDNTAFSDYVETASVVLKNVGTHVKKNPPICERLGDSR